MRRGMAWNRIEDRTHPMGPVDATQILESHSRRGQTAWQTRQTPTDTNRHRRHHRHHRHHGSTMAQKPRRAHQAGNPPTRLTCINIPPKRWRKVPSAHVPIPGYPYPVCMDGRTGITGVIREWMDWQMGLGK